MLAVKQAGKAVPAEDYGSQRKQSRALDGVNFYKEVSECSEK